MLPTYSLSASASHPGGGGSRDTNCASGGSLERLRQGAARGRVEGVGRGRQGAGHAAPEGRGGGTPGVSQPSPPGPSSSMQHQQSPPPALLPAPAPVLQPAARSLALAPPAARLRLFTSASIHLTTMGSGMPGQMYVSSSARSAASASSRRAMVTTPHPCGAHLQRRQRERLPPRHRACFDPLAGSHRQRESGNSRPPRPRWRQCGSARPGPRTSPGPSPRPSYHTQPTSALLAPSTPLLRKTTLPPTKPPPPKAAPPPTRPPARRALW